MTVGVLLLAGGRSVRFGSDKRLALLPDGKTVLEATLVNIQASKLPVLVCLENGENSVAAAEICDRMCVEFVFCNTAGRGMGHTLAEGVAHISSWQGALVALADMPFIQATTYRQLGKAVSADTICRSVFDGRVGHPVAFGENYFAELATLSGDVGARKLLSKYANIVSTVDCSDPGVLQDIDRPSDLS